jgi:hypothetical protein
LQLALVRMPALFPRWANTAYGVTLAAIGLGATLVIAAPMVYMRPSYANHVGDRRTPPVEVDHRHHVRDDGIACLYCHPGAEASAQAGVPPTETCMGCHGQIWPDSPLLAPVRASYFSGQPIAWKRVHALPDFVYFHHGVHTQAGIACVRCHGRVEDMARVARVAPLTMEWCLECHRQQQRPARAITALTTCTACHR